MYTLHDAAVELAAYHGPDQPASDAVWEVYRDACREAGQEPADTHQGAAIHAFLLAMGEIGHRQLDVTVRHLLDTGRVV